MEITKMVAPEIVCDGCAASIKKALQIKPGIVDVKVNVAEKSVAVTHEASVTRKMLVDGMDEAGFAVSE